MILTYYALLELESGTSERKGQIIGELLSFIEESDYLSHASTETRLVFNENALKGLHEFVQSYEDNEDCALYMVAINEDESIYDHLDQDLNDFEDAIEIFPNMDESRVDAITLDFKRSTDQRRSGFEKSEEKISFDKVSQIVKPVVSSIEDHEEIEDPDLAEIARLLPTKEKLLQSTSAKLDIDDDSQMAEIIISSSESSLAIMHTLMSDELDQVEDLDVEQINKIILSKIAESDQAKGYLKSRSLLDEFLKEVNDRKKEIETQYEREMNAYIEQMVEKLKEEYRSKVPDETDRNLQLFYSSIEDQYNMISGEHDATTKALNDRIMKDFTTADRSPAMKALKKYLTLKDQIRNSALRSIERLHTAENSMNEISSIPVEVPTSRPQIGLNDADREELERLRREKAERIEIERQQELERQQALERQRDLERRAEIDRQAELERQQEIERRDSNAEESAVTELVSDPNKIEDDSEDQVSATAVAATAATAATAAAVLSDDSASAKEIQPELEDQEHLEDSAETEDLSDDQNVRDESEEHDDEMQQVQTASVNLEDLSDDESFEDEGFLEESEETKKPRKKMKLPMKIGLIAAGVIASVVIVFTGVKMLNGSSSNSNEPGQEQTSESNQSQQIEDTIFNVGDVLTITGSNGESLDVTIKEFKSDGSAVAEDANKDKWLITRDQMSEYAKSHPEQFKKSNSGSNDSKSSETTTSESKTSESKSSDSSTSETSKTTSNKS